jgi:hypothetical protein
VLIAPTSGGETRAEIAEKISGFSHKVLESAGKLPARTLRPGQSFRCAQTAVLQFKELFPLKLPRQRQSAGASFTTDHPGIGHCIVRSRLRVD